MIETDIQLEFEISGPFLVQSSTGGEYGVDAAALRDIDGSLVLTGSQVRGRIREALCEFCALGQLKENQLAEWLGPELPNELGTVDPDQGLRPHNWHFSDFTAVAPSDSTIVTRIQIEAETGAVKRGALQMIESGVAIGQTAKFSGIVCVSGNNQKEIDTAIQWLKRAAAWVPSFGAFRNVGFGAVKSVKPTVTETRASRENLTTGMTGPVSVLGKAAASHSASAAPGEATAASADTRRRFLRIEMEEPFCIGSRRRTLNTFESLKYIPGSIIKGVIAQVVKRIYGKAGSVDLTTLDGARLKGAKLDELCKAFPGLRFCTAFPADADAKTVRRPVVPPLSLFTDSAGNLRDAALINGPFVIRKGDSVEAPRFAPDWKGTPAGWDTGWLDPHVELRIRTAIDSGRRRARNEFLFAQELVHPFSIRRDVHGLDSGDRPKVIWRGEVTLDKSIADPASVWQQLESLLGWAVFRIGKTKARARFSFEPVVRDAQYESSLAPVDNRWVIVLQSPALLIDPRELEDHWQKGRDVTQDLYERAFTEVAAGHLKLINLFIDQSLQGGFLAHRCNPGEYKPFLLTEAGSCFVLQANGDANKAREQIESWFKHGLPLPKWAVDLYGADFTTNPFTPTNGFGEIVVNLPRQLEGLRADPETIETIQMCEKEAKS